MEGAIVEKLNWVWRSETMLSKCTNPVCGAKFQYLHAGKLFVIEYRNSTDRLRYFWLCPL